MFSAPDYLRLRAKYEKELAQIMDSVPESTSLAEFVVDKPEKGKRLVWLLIACNIDVIDRVVEHAGLDRDKVYAEAYEPVLKRRVRKNQYIPERLRKHVEEEE